MNLRLLLKIICKTKTKPAEPQKFGILKIKLLCDCTIVIGNLSIKPDFPWLRKYISTPVVHNLLPAAFSNLNSTIITEHTLYKELDEIINHQWVNKVPLLNLTIAGFRASTYYTLWSSYVIHNICLDGYNNHSNILAYYPSSGKYRDDSSDLYSTSLNERKTSSW